MKIQVKNADSNPKKRLIVNKDTSQTISCLIALLILIVLFSVMILNSNRIFVGAAGRSLLAMKFLAMRLMQIGLKVYLVGEVCTPSIREGDLLLVGSGSGETAGMIAICKKAKAAGAEVAVFTKNRNSTIASYIPHIEFDEEIKKVKAVIRTGGYWLHAPNVILQAGCTYDE